MDASIVAMVLADCLDVKGGGRTIMLMSRFLGASASEWPITAKSMFWPNQRRM